MGLSRTRTGSSGGFGGRSIASFLLANPGRGLNEPNNMRTHDGNGDVERNTYFPICFECHLIENFSQFNPHVNQISSYGKVNREMCLICHAEVPDRRLLEEKNFKLRKDLSYYCIGCHRGKIYKHPSDQDHYGALVEGPYWGTMQITSKKNQSFLPLKNGEIIVCSTCHNPHESQVVMDISAQGGGNAAARLRVAGRSLCASCHVESKAPKKVMSPF